jgi:hypothetical protein
MEADEENPQTTPFGWMNCFQNFPLCPEASRDKILERDKWVSESFLTASFRAVLEAGDTLEFRFGG